MAAMTSSMVPVGTPAPEFSLPDPSGAPTSIGDFDGRPVVVAFLCNHCPYVKRIAGALPSIVGALGDLEVGFVAVNSNDAESYPDDAPAAMTDFASTHGWRFPYVVDATQEVAAAYGAVCTPDFFLYDHSHRLAYRGQMDDARPGNDEPVTGRDLIAAARTVVAGDAVSEPHHPSMGCGIKWKPGNAPD